MLTPENRTRINLSSPAVIGDCWITSASYPFLAALAADPTYTAFVDKYIIMACAQINRMCNRFWNLQTADEVFVSEDRRYLTYQQYTLVNDPVVSIIDAYLQVNNTFLKLSLTYLQLFNQERTIRVLPFDIAVAGTYVFPKSAAMDSIHLWVRYVSGLATADIPEDIKYATALMVNFLINADKNLEGLNSFSTQTYSQSNSGVKNNPLMERIAAMLAPYVLYTLK